jgi:hypothetical protein
MAARKILYIDIETAPLRGFSWGIWEQDIIEVDQDWFMLSFSAQINDGPIKVYALPDYRGYKSNKTKDLWLCHDLYKLIDEADVVVGHNSDKFDLRKANARFIYWGFQPPAPYKTVDTLKVARKYFKFDSNRLDDLARYLGVGRKLPTHGKQTWLGCMDGDMKAWAEMKKYNKQDVKLLHDIYDKLKNWTTNHPIMGDHEACPVCGSFESQSRGYNMTKAGKKPRIMCLVCGTWRQGKLMKT